MDIVVVGADYTQPATLEKLRETARSYRDDKDVKSVDSWFKTFETWRSETGLTNSSAAFYTDLGAFLKLQQYFSKTRGQTQPAKYQADLSFSRGDGKKLTASRMQARVAVPNAVTPRIAVTKRLRDTIKAVGWADAWVYGYGHLFTDRDEIIVSIITDNLLICVLVVTQSMVLFVHPGIAVLICVCVCGIDGFLLLLMYAWDVPLDGGTFICLAMAVGLSVDYTVHVAHAVMHSTGDDDDHPQRTRDAVTGMGVAVFQGGISTFFGISLLAFSHSGVFVIFFKMLFGIVLFGLSFGLAFFPAALRWTGVLCKPSHSIVQRGEGEEGAKKAAEVVMAEVENGDAIAKPVAAEP